VYSDKTLKTREKQEENKRKTGGEQLENRRRTRGKQNRRKTGE